MTTIRQPETTLTLVNANQDIQNTAQRILFVGQKTAAGTHGGAGALRSDIPADTSVWEAEFGKSSQLSGMVRAGKEMAPIVAMDAIVLDDAVGTARVVTSAITGTATSAGTLKVVAGSKDRHTYELAVSVGDAAAAVANAMLALVNADGNCPFTASAPGAVLTLTADNDGTVANSLGVEVSGIIPGLTIGAVTEATPGATDPTLTNVFDVLASDVRYTQVVWPYSDSVGVLTTFLDARFNSTNNVLDGMAVTCAVDSHANHITRLSSLNSQSLIEICDKAESETAYKGPSQVEPSYQKSASVAGLRAIRLTEGASLEQFLTSRASLDQFGGPALASLPYFNSVIPSLPIIENGRGWTELEVTQLQAAGGSVLGVNKANNGGLVGELVTTYLTDGAGDPDVTWTFANYVDTASQAREYMANNLISRFGQSRLTEGTVARQRDQANATTINAYVDKLYQDLGGPNFVLVQSGEDAVQFFKRNRTTVLDLSTGTATVTMLLPIVTQLRVILATVQITFSTGG
jgi:phage tail sheath gpL-like